jgi:hypothetical protein
MIAPFLNPVAAQDHWRRARTGRGNPRLTYSLFVLLAWLDSRSTATLDPKWNDPAQTFGHRS